MAAAFDVQADFAQVADQLEAVTLERADGAESSPLAGALRRAIGTREAAASGGKYTAADVRWHLAAAVLAAAPRLGDRIIDAAGEAWTILETRLATCGSRYECASRNLAIAAGLDTSITIRREQIAKSASGAVERCWTDYRINVRARIQEQSARRGEQHGRQSGIVTAKIYLAEQIAIDNGFRIVAADGTLYEVIGCANPDSITGLFTITAERRL